MSHVYDTSRALYGCMVGIFILLLAATIFSRWLTYKNPANQTFGKTQIIVRSWWALVSPIMLALMMGPTALLILFFVVTCYALIEIIQHSRYVSLKKPLMIFFTICTALQYVALYMKWSWVFLTLIPLTFIWVIPLLIIFRAEIKTLPQIMALVMGVLLVSYYLSYIPALPLLKPSLWVSQDQALLAILILILTTELNDIFQFLVGKTFGRRKIFPQISPHKTEAGFIGGLLGTIFLFMWLGPNFLGISWWPSLLMGFLISMIGILGDLLFSSVKRYYGVKDFSDLIPGHGGLMDRLDSLVLTAPLYFHLVYFFKDGGG